MNFSCIIVEDLQPAAEILARYCQRSGIVDVQSHFTNAEDALEYLKENHVDLIFLDIEMPGISGFELLDRLSGNAQVILTTSKTEYAYDAFQYNVTDYLRKPFHYSRFLESIQKIKARREETESTAGTGPIFIKVDGKLVRLNSEDVLYIESMGDYVRFITKDRKYVTHNTIKNIETRVDAMRFMKVHRSYIVNLSHVDDIQDDMVVIKGAMIPVSKAHKTRIRKQINVI
jgi:DNA-binding LytR/AlgR family response regulator